LAPAQPFEIQAKTAGESEFTTGFGIPEFGGKSIFGLVGAKLFNLNRDENGSANGNRVAGVSFWRAESLVLAR